VGGVFGGSCDVSERSGAQPDRAINHRIVDLVEWAFLILRIGGVFFDAVKEETCGFSL